MNVKQERQDEAEIRELAAKLMEANKVKMNSPQRHQPQSQNINLLNFLSGGDKSKPKNNTGAEDTKNIDEESQKGRFGWTMMGKIHIPYIMRSGEKYCAVRMVEMKVLNKLLNFLHQDLYNCTNIRSYYITEAEARLLNEINFKHCDYQFGREQFTSRDLIVRLVDGNEFYQFLGHCYAKLSNNDTEKVKNLDRCGFIRINKESVVPYTLYNELKYVPLFYFEGETDNLRQRADKLEGWDLAYLKFCCKVQGIRNELFAHETCSVISLNDIKNYFPPGTIFEDYWPKKNLESQLLISKTSNPTHNTIQWTRQPTAPPNTHPSPSPKPATQAKAPNSHMHNMHNMYNPNYTMAGGQPSYHGSQQPRTASGAVRTTYPSATNRMRPYYAPPPLIRANASTLAQYNAQSKAASGGYMIIEPNATQNNYHQASQSSYPPPPLLHMNGGLPRDLQNNYGVNSTSTQMVNQQPAHQSSRTPVAHSAEQREALTNGRSINRNNSGKPIQLSDAPTAGTNNIPYKVQKALVEGKMIPCINMKPNIWTDMLVSLPDLITNFFNNVPVQSCQQVLQVLGIDVYKANSSQMRLLVDSGMCINSSENVLLVQVRNVIDFMPQLKYMLSGMLSSEVASKRQRNS
ncbi:uncharacterized protein LOC114339461 isoform X2 [Diabrotica virgifera virgifera]|uniref:Uncharacterized protein n=1 Tax=Diabrotica virgifera virgifera TaxID=50390 RepID=A0ABM5JHR2_DIAVI|nr:uncharacterized protein LOC114339461 isoform X2 [Diabrotica virgifera virgifera]